MQLSKSGSVEVPHSRTSGPSILRREGSSSGLSRCRVQMPLDFSDTTAAEQPLEECSSFNCVVHLM
eukprot:3738740-Amphidinium_carterae.1